MVNTKSTVWGSMFNAATAAEVIEHLGRDHVAAIMRRHNPAGLAVSRATGCWDANDGEGYSAYTRLAQLILAGEVQAALEAAPHRMSWSCGCAACVTARKTLGRAFAAAG